MKNTKLFLRKIAIICGWLLLWQAAAIVIHNSILLEGPFGVLRRLFLDTKSLEYYRIIGHTLVTINGGFLLGMLLAVVLSGLAWKSPLLEEILSPVVHFLKASPIACFIVLLLIWAGSEKLAFYVAVLVAFPPIYLNLLEGFRNMPVEKLEVAKVYCMPLKNRLFFVYMPHLEPYFMSALKLTVGMTFKAGIAAEIIGTPDVSVGESIYMSKIYLDTTGVLSWLITVIFLSFLCEKVYIHLAKVCLKRKPVCKERGKKNHSNKISPVVLENITVCYGKEVVLDKVSYTFMPGKCYGIMGLSGIGKTTLLRTIAGLEKRKLGTIEGMEGICPFVFQENRLFEECTALENIFATGQCIWTKEKAESVLQQILPKNSDSKPVSEYSGGMKRRVEIARAMLTSSNVVLLDEAFNGLDSETKKQVAGFIREYLQERILIFTTHSEEDIELIKGEKVELWNLK